MPTQCYTRAAFEINRSLSHQSLKYGRVLCECSKEARVRDVGKQKGGVGRKAKRGMALRSYGGVGTSAHEGDEGGTRQIVRVERGVAWGGTK